MATLSLDSTQIHRSPFHFNIPAAISALSFAIALFVCFEHGDIAAIPALLFLMAMQVIVFFVDEPTADKAPCGDAGKPRDEYRVSLLRRECLG